MDRVLDSTAESNNLASESMCVALAAVKRITLVKLTKNVKNFKIYSIRYSYASAKKLSSRVDFGFKFN